MTVTDWRFADDESDGEIWLQLPMHAHAYVDYASSQNGHWRRIGVATRSYVERALANVRDSNVGPLCAVLPTLLVVPDADGDTLREFVNVALQMPGLDHWSTAIDE